MVIGSIEFYVICAFLAASVIAISALPSRRGAARSFFYAGDLLFDVSPSQPGIVAEVDEHGMLNIYRFGLEGVGESGAYSLALTIIGFDVTIDERLTPGRRGEPQATAAHVRIDSLGRERYHFHFRSDATGRSAAFNLNISPGNRIERRLE